MVYNPAIHHRRSIRLKGYDYAQAGLYFITICVQDRRNLFGEIIEVPAGMNGAPTRGARTELVLNEAGKMVEKEWLAIAVIFPNIILHEYIVMPNHFHSIIEIAPKNVGAPLVGAQIGAQKTIGSKNNWRNNWGI
jgi:putative transposase